MATQVQVPRRSHVRACDMEQIHVPRAIQPHGVLLAFDLASERLVHWGGDCAGLLGIRAKTSASVHDLLCRTIKELLCGRRLPAAGEPVRVASIDSARGEPVGVCAHRCGSLIVLELEAGTSELDATATLEQVRSISDGIAGSESIEAACIFAASYVRDVSGFDRVMVYQFCEDMSGAVIAEACSPGAGSYLGHRFPASDIPAQARELYKRSLLRIIPDADYCPMPLQPANGAALDMSHCELRSVSSIHLQYLKNMGVAASMSVSIMAGGELWGLIACHHFTPRSVPADRRLLCRHVGTALAAFIRNDLVTQLAKDREDRSRVLEQVLAGLRASNDPEAALRASAQILLSMVDCSGVVMFSGGLPVAMAGRLPGGDLLAALGDIAARELEQRVVFTSDQLGAIYPQSAVLAAQASGIIAIRIDGSPELILAWIRPEQVEEIVWAGNPNAKAEAGARAIPLSPRRSFASWHQAVRGRSRRWSKAEIEVAARFRSRTDFILQRDRLQRVNEQLEQANQRLRTLATTDPLTGLANRRLFEERLATEWRRALRDCQPIALVAVDVDNFKTYNDNFGHPAGDECLRRIARALNQGRRGGDLVARVGGEEFALLLPGTDIKAARALAERLRSSVEGLKLDHPMSPAGVVTVSLGVSAGRPAAREEAGEYWEAADCALYQAKQAGRNRVAGGSRGQA